MHFLHFILSFLVALFLFINPLKAQDSQIKYGVQDEVIAKTIIVDQKGRGNFRSVQKAIDSVPSNNKLWILIHVKPGLYNEKVQVPRDKPFIVLEGKSRRETIIQWEEAGHSYTSSPFILAASNFVAAKISFKNTYNIAINNITDENGHRILWAPAAVIQGDKASFYDCSFSSVQDTLTDAHGRHYFKSSYIQGAVDFIWGYGQSYYERCLINATAIDGGDSGYITAQGRESQKDPSGFVFNLCNIVGNGKVYLGRAYREYSRVVFKQTFMSDIVRPEGWKAWNAQGKENLVTYAEVDCRGPGSNLSKRVKWLKHLTPSELLSLTDINAFINQDGWIQAQPYKFRSSPSS